MLKTCGAELGVSDLGRKIWGLWILAPTFLKLDEFLPPVSL